MKETDVLPVTPEPQPGGAGDRQPRRLGLRQRHHLHHREGLRHRLPLRPLLRRLQPFGRALPPSSYNDGSGVKTIETSGSSKLDRRRRARCSAIPFNATGSSLQMATGGNGYGAALPLRSAHRSPRGPTITNARMQFVPYQTLERPDHGQDLGPTPATTRPPSVRLRHAAAVRVLSGRGPPRQRRAGPWSPGPG
ncbi:MAG: hypothetical protein MZV70_28925 [Desulfobacterales bacterium]|nr:hypothetical protein [Desulfobacterales bacterium]